MKKINKTRQLNKRIKELIDDRDKFYDLYHEEMSTTSELREKTTKEHLTEISQLNRTIGFAGHEIDRLMDIIKWQINPSTAERKLTKEQEEKLRRGF